MSEAELAAQISQEKTQTQSEPKQSAFKTISVVAGELGIEPHVLRFWETKFPEIVPHKHNGGRRLYRAEDIILVRGIHHLLHKQGLTIKGAQKLLAHHGLGYIKALGEGRAPESLGSRNAPPSINQTNRRTLEDIHEKLTQAHSLLTNGDG